MDEIKFVEINESEIDKKVEELAKRGYTKFSNLSPQKRIFEGDLYLESRPIGALVFIKKDAKVIPVIERRKQYSNMQGLGKYYVFAELDEQEFNKWREVHEYKEID